MNAVYDIDPFLLPDPVLAEPTPARFISEPYDTKFVRSYKRWLTQFNDLKDCAYLPHDHREGGNRRERWRDAELEELRNTGNPYVERPIVGCRWPKKLYRNAFTPTEADIANMLVSHGPRTIWMTNSSTFDTLLLLADIDDKAGTADVDGAAAYLSQTYLNGQTYTEPSTWGKGRHVYFLLDTRLTGVSHYGQNRQDIWEALRWFADQIKADAQFQKFGVTFDNVFYGQPTIWERKNAHVLTQRGTLVKLPFLPNEREDLQRLQALTPLSFERLWEASQRQAREPATNHKEYLCVTNTRRYEQAVDPADIADAFQKKKLCIDLLLKKTNGECTLDDVQQDYQQNWHPSGMSGEDQRRRRKLLERMLAERLKTYNPSTAFPHAFRRDQYLQLVTGLVDASAFVWKRRERLDHQRLADFLSLKLQDAFYDPDQKATKGYFAAQTREATINCMRQMKAKKVIDWVCNSHTYKRLLEICVQYKLLHVYEEARKPTFLNGMKFKGKGAVIGPGDGLPDLKADWLKLYSRSLAKTADNLLAA